MKPKIMRISQWGSATEIVYGCPKCNVSFFYGQGEKFCHNCGMKFDWDRMPAHVGSEFAKKYHNSKYSEQKVLIQKLNDMLAKYKRY